MQLDPPLYLIGVICGLTAGIIIMLVAFRRERFYLRQTIANHEITINAHKREIKALNTILDAQANAIRRSRRESDTKRPDVQRAWPTPTRPRATMRPLVERTGGEVQRSRVEDIALGAVIGSVASRPAETQDRSHCDTGSGGNDSAPSSGGGCSYDSGSNGGGDTGGSSGGGGE